MAVQIVVIYNIWESHECDAQFSTTIPRYHVKCNFDTDPCQILCRPDLCQTQCRDSFMSSTMPARIHVKRNVDKVPNQGKTIMMHVSLNLDKLTRTNVRHIFDTVGGIGGIHCTMSKVIEQHQIKYYWRIILMPLFIAREQQCMKVRGEMLSGIFKKSIRKVHVWENCILAQYYHAYT